MQAQRERQPTDSDGGDLVVQTRQVSKRYGRQTALAGLDLDVGRGLVLGVIGPSGSGKTTAVRLLTGITEPTSGTVSVFGVTPTDFTAEHRTRIGYMPQLSVLYPQLSLWENLNFAASIYGVPLRRRQRLRDALRLVELEGDANKRLRDASGGMQRRLALAATLVHEPELLFLDEPTAGVDPVLRRKFWDHFGQLKQEGRTLLVTTQYVGEAAYCDLVAVLVEGHLLTVDTPEGLQRQAFGGELVDVLAQDPLDEDTRDGLRAQEDVLDVSWSGADRRALRMLVRDAGEVVPRISRWLDTRQTRIRSIERHVPPFDDVFVALVQRPTGNKAPGGPAPDGPRVR